MTKNGSASSVTSSSMTRTQAACPILLETYPSRKNLSTTSRSRANIVCMILSAARWPLR